MAIECTVTVMPVQRRIMMQTIISALKTKNFVKGIESR